MITTNSSTLETYAIETKGITKTFGAHLALRGVDVRVKQGETVAVLGPNGAGKTTLLKVLSTIMNPSSGKLFIFGMDAKTDAEKVRAKIGVVSHQCFFYTNLTAFENLEFYARMYGIENYRERILKIVDTVGMSHRMYDRISTLSRGMQQRLSIARALLHEPELVLLDEPETGLDQQALSMLFEIIRGDGKAKRAIVLSTHNLGSALDMGDRIIILRQGKIVNQQERQNLNLESLRQIYIESTAVKK